MNDDELAKVQQALEQASLDQNTGPYVLSLYISGVTPKSTRAIANIKAICENYLPGHYELEIIDIYQQPELAREVDVVAVPTLIKQLPPPLRKLVGDMSDELRVLAGLGVRKKS